MAPDPTSQRERQERRLSLFGDNSIGSVSRALGFVEHPERQTVHTQYIYSCRENHAYIDLNSLGLVT
jgi:hypothetical protein